MIGLVLAPATEPPLRSVVMIELKSVVSASLPAADGSASSNAYDLRACVLKSRRASKLSAAALLTEFTSTLAHDRGTTVDLLIQMGEIEARKLYVSKACADMYAYCTEVLHMSESTASRRIRTARAARQFPVILPMIAEGKLHLSAVSLLATHLRPQNVASLLAEATHRSKAEVELILARRFPRPDVPESVRPLSEPNTASSPTAQVVANIAAQLSPVTVVPTISNETAKSVEPLCAGDETRAVHQVVSQVVAAAAAAAAKRGSEAVPDSMLASIADAVAQTIVNAAASVAPNAALPGEAHAKVTPRSAGRYAWQLTADQEMQELFEEAQQLIGHAGPRDLQAVLKRALEVLVATLRKAKYAATSQPREAPVNANGRPVPHAVVRAVSERDGCQCAFKDPDGRRCSERINLQFDHVIPFARGGQTTVENVRLLCVVHNQHEAERVYGETHMREQRAASRARAEQTSAARAEAALRARGKHESARGARTVETRAGARRALRERGVPA